MNKEEAIYVRNSTNKKKIKTVISVLIILLLASLLMLATYSGIEKDIEKLNVCEREYGYKETTFRDSKGSIDLNYTVNGINKTHFACCKKQEFIDLTGQLRKLNCTNIYEKENE